MTCPRASAGAGQYEQSTNKNSLFPGMVWVWHAAVHRADRCTLRVIKVAHALHALLRADFVDLLSFRNRLDWALKLASTTKDTLIGDHVSQFGSPPFSRRCLGKTITILHGDGVFLDRQPPKALYCPAEDRASYGQSRHAICHLREVLTCIGTSEPSPHPVAPIHSFRMPMATLVRNQRHCSEILTIVKKQVPAKRLLAGKTIAYHECNSL